MLPSVLPEVLPAQSLEIEIADFDVEIVVYDPRVKIVHLLTHATALVFDSCDGVTTSQALIAEFVDAGAGEPDEVAALIELSLAELSALGLLDGSEPSMPPPCLGCESETSSRGRFRRLIRSSK